MPARTPRRTGCPRWTLLLGLLDSVSGHPVDTVMSGQATTNHLQGGSSMSIRWFACGHRGGVLVAGRSDHERPATMHGGRAWTVPEWTDGCPFGPQAVQCGHLAWPAGQGERTGEQGQQQAPAL